MSIDPYSGDVNDSTKTSKTLVNVPNPHSRFNSLPSEVKIRFKYLHYCIRLFISKSINQTTIRV